MCRKIDTSDIMTVQASWIDCIDVKGVKVGWSGVCCESGLLSHLQVYIVFSLVY